MDTKAYLEASYNAAGLTPRREELERWSKRYEQARAAADTMFDLAGVKYAEPAAVFHAG